MVMSFAIVGIDSVFLLLAAPLFSSNMLTGHI